ncbi:hypothetical protein BV20DRAFT_975810 [Pilatotrama ljubarskyi]|nr:hypothetical protein BV20DRAFT_975810 [Pilatotrama ljubarskyi]
MTSRSSSRMATTSRVDPNAPWPIGQNAWLVLTEDVNEQFPRGMLVRIVGHVPLFDSPSPYPGQSAPPETRDSVNYRFEKMVITTHISYHRSADGVDAVTPNKISVQRDGRPIPDAVFTPGQLVYVRDTVAGVPFPEGARGSALDVPIGVRAKIREAFMSRDALSKPLRSGPRHKAGARYILTYAVESETKEPLRCRVARPHTAFRLPRAEEAEQIRRIRAPPAQPKVINMSNE